MANELLAPTQLRGGQAQTVPVITTCPHCSVLVNGSCVVCGPEFEGHPSCRDCNGGDHEPRRSWYESDIAVTVGLTVVTSFIGAVVWSYMFKALQED